MLSDEQNKYILTGKQFASIKLNVPKTTYTKISVKYFSL